MTTRSGEPEPRIAIWSLSARVIGAYFAIFLVQYVPGVAFEAYTYWQQRAADEAVVRTVVEIIKASGPIGVGSATNAIAIAMLVEAVMVLARIISKHQREEGFRQGMEQGVKQERERSNAKLRASNARLRASNARMRELAEQYGIPEDQLLIEPEDQDEDE